MWECEVAKRFVVGNLGRILALQAARGHRHGGEQSPFTAFQRPKDRPQAVQEAVYPCSGPLQTPHCKRQDCAGDYLASSEGLQDFTAALAGRGRLFMMAMPSALV
jgi:hypothetical protein